MVKDMTTELQNKLCGDGEGGIIGIWLVALPGSYDHKRQRAACKLKKPFPAEAAVPLWDFVVYNHDGQGYRFHVGQTNKKVQISGLDKQTVARANYRTKPPNRGPGKSDGPGPSKPSSKSVTRIR